MNTKKTVFVFGHFNVLHPGHLRLLRFAHECGDFVIVAVISDQLAGKSAYVDEQSRLEGVSSNNWVNEAFITHEPIDTVIGRLRPDIVVKGHEYESRINPEQAVIESYGGKLLFGSGETTFSSLDLLQKEFYQSTTEDIQFPSGYLVRHSIQINQLKSLIKKFTSLQVCVVGDLIVDEYITCEPLGMSQEDPTIVVTPVDTTRFIGGAGVVAAHASGLGAQVDFVSVSGVDTGYDYAQDSLTKLGVKTHIIQDESRPTTIKQRFRSKGKSLLRVSHLHQTAINSTLQTQIMSICESIMPKVDLLVFSDFNYGCLPQSLVEQITSLAKSCNTMLAADSQSSSQIGNIARFKGMNLITPTEREARISTRNHEDGLVILADQLQKQSSTQNILLKIGEEGLLIYADSNNNGQWLTDRLHALNSAARDVAGAGDSLLISSALTLVSGGNIWEAAFIGSLAAGIQVGRVGNTPLKVKELLQELG